MSTLTNAYHDIYDVKDSLTPGTQGHYTAYEALGKLADLMRLLGVPVPNRHDGEGRRS